MSKVFLVVGSTGAGKTTYARELAEREGAIRFSMDPWMQTLFGKDLELPIRYEWMIERVQRCESQMWQMVEQLIARDVPAVLDCGFFELRQRDAQRKRAEALGARILVHFLDVPAELRRARVAQRNREKDPAVYAFDVTDAMFDFMEPRFERPSALELEGGLCIAHGA